jgi:hypothetical protein
MPLKISFKRSWKDAAPTTNDVRLALETRHSFISALLPAKILAIELDQGPMSALGQKQTFAPQ